MDALALAALTYAEEGRIVFPLSDRGTPLVKWSALEYDYARTAEFWREFPGSGIGVRLGRESDLWLLDVDMPSERKPDRADGVQSLAALVLKHGEIPKTMVSMTPGGGYHLWFRYPEGVEIRNSVSEIAPSLDTKGRGGMGTLPPTRVQRGTYRMMYDRPTRPAFAPQWLIDLAKAPDRAEPVEWTPPPRAHVVGTSRYGAAALRRASESVAACAEGERHRNLNREAYGIGRLVGGMEIDFEEAFTVLRAAGEACGLPPRDAETTTRDGLRAGMRNPRQRP